MRVIEHGETMTWAGTEVRCYFCKAKLSVEIGDLITWQDYCGVHEEKCTEIGVRCPECNAKVAVKDVPLAVRLKLMR